MLALLPQPPDRSYYESPERPVGLASRLAFGDPPVQISLGFRKVMSLREHNAVQGGVETSVAASIQAMADQASR